MAANDGTDLGRHAVQVGRAIADRAGARLVEVYVETRSLPPSRDGRRPAQPPSPSAGVLWREGVPGVEITRCAEEWGADLLVLGRRLPNTPDGLGPTTETVLRRRRGPTLLAPVGIQCFRRVVFALDGTERGLRILPGAGPAAAATGAVPLALCVLPRDTYDLAGDPRWGDPRRVLVEGAMARHPELGGPDVLRVRQGPPVSEILQHLAEVEADLLVLGIRQGGPGGDPGSGHVARDLLRVVPTAVLAVPI